MISVEVTKDFLPLAVASFSAVKLHRDEDTAASVTFGAWLQTCKKAMKERK